MRQVFHRTVYGDVAGGNIYNIDLGTCPEYQAQHNFHACTGISCSYQAREQLIRLADRDDFRFQELRRAIGQGALVWRRDAQQWAAAAPWADYFMALALMCCAVLFTLIGAGLAWDRLSSGHALLATLMTASVFMVAAGLLQLQFVLPHRIARRAVLALNNPGRGSIEGRKA